MTRPSRSCKRCPYQPKLSLTPQQLYAVDASKLKCSNAHCPNRRVFLLRRKIFAKNNKKGVNKVVANNPNMMSHRGNSNDMRNNDFNSWCVSLRSENVDEQLRAAVLIRNAVCDANPPVQELIECGVVPPLIQMLECHDNARLQKEAAWALTNMVSGKEEHTDVVIRNGAIPIFVRLLSSPKLSVADQAVWALGNIAGDTVKSRNLVLEAGAMPQLLKLFDRFDELCFVRNVVWAVSNLCRFKPRPYNVLRTALPVLAKQLNHTDEQVVGDVCWCFSYLSDDDTEQGAFIKAVVNTNVCKRLVELLGHRNPNIQTTALRSIGNIVTGDDKDTQAVLNFDPLPSLLKLLTHENDAIRKEAAWTVSNITAGPSEHIQAVIDANIIDVIIPLARDLPLDLQTEAVYAVCNATAMASETQVQYLVSHGIFQPLCDILDYGLKDGGYVPIVSIAINGIDNLLYKGQILVHVEDIDCGCDKSVSRLVSHHHDPFHHCVVNRYASEVLKYDGLRKLELLQQHTHFQIRTLAVKIVQSYCFMTCAEHREHFEGMMCNKDDNGAYDSSLLETYNVRKPSAEAEESGEFLELSDIQDMIAESNARESGSSDVKRNDKGDMSETRDRIGNENMNQESNQDSVVQVVSGRSCCWNKCQMSVSTSRSRLISVEQEYCEIECSLACGVRYHYPQCWQALLEAKEYHARKRAAKNGSSTVLRLEVDVPCFSANCVGCIKCIGVFVNENRKSYIVEPKKKSDEEQYPVSPSPTVPTEPTVKRTAPKSKKVPPSNSTTTTTTSHGKGGNTNNNNNSSTSSSSDSGDTTKKKSRSEHVVSNKTSNNAQVTTQRSKRKSRKKAAPADTVKSIVSPNVYKGDVRLSQGATTRIILLRSIGDTSGDHLVKLCRQVCEPLQAHIIYSKKTHSRSCVIEFLTVANAMAVRNCLGKKKGKRKLWTSVEFVVEPLPMSLSSSTSDDVDSTQTQSSAEFPQAESLIGSLLEPEPEVVTSSQHNSFASWTNVPHDDGTLQPLLPSTRPNNSNNQTRNNSRQRWDFDSPFATSVVLPPSLDTVFGSPTVHRSNNNKRVRSGLNILGTTSPAISQFVEHNSDSIWAASSTSSSMSSAVDLQVPSFKVNANDWMSAAPVGVATLNDIDDVGNNNHADNVKAQATASFVSTSNKSEKGHDGGSYINTWPRSLHR